MSTHDSPTTETTDPQPQPTPARDPQAIGLALAEQIHRGILNVKRAGYQPGWILLGFIEYHDLTNWMYRQILNSMHPTYGIAPLSNPRVFEGCNIARVDFESHVEVTIKGL